MGASLSGDSTSPRRYVSRCKRLVVDRSECYAHSYVGYVGYVLVGTGAGRWPATRAALLCPPRPISVATVRSPRAPLLSLTSPQRSSTLKITSIYLQLMCLRTPGNCYIRFSIYSSPLYVMLSYNLRLCDMISHVYYAGYHRNNIFLLKVNRCILN